MSLTGTSGQPALPSPFYAVILPGFDTASSIALLAISAIARRDPDGQQINPADNVILPVRKDPPPSRPAPTNPSPISSESDWVGRGGAIVILM